MSSIGYFTEIEILNLKIKELEQKIQEERDEHRDIYIRLKSQNEILCIENTKLKNENISLKTKIEQLIQIEDNIL